MASFETLFRLLPHSRQLVQGVAGMRNQSVLPPNEHLRLCGEWLLTAHRCSPTGGYSAMFSIVMGWGKGYIETTGYIIPTLLDMAGALGEPEWRRSALECGEWLLGGQNEDGSFPDIHEWRPQVFDTGQVLLGLSRMLRETGDERYRKAGRRACEWLMKVQDPDGSWTTVGSPDDQPRTYHTRVAAAMIEFGRLSFEPRFVEAGGRFLSWAAEMQMGNGFFRHSELATGAAPVLHTMVYVLEGFLMAYHETGHARWLEVLRRGAEPLMRINLERDLVLYSQYHHDFQPANREKCLPGLAQWAALCLALHEITGERGYYESGAVSLYYLQSKQLQSPGVLRGSLPASIPIWGYYHPYCFVNWGVKFLADALLLFRRAPLTVWAQQELWVRQCFRLQMDGGAWERHSRTLDAADARVLNAIEETVAGQPAGARRVLDIGCGAGRYLDELRARHGDWKLEGVDPFAPAGLEGVAQGSACRLPFPDETFDVAYAHIALQHVADLPRAFSEIQRVLKPGGALLISNRNPVSLRGVLKPWHELRGRWMYPWDSPFRERWLSPSQWRSVLRQAGFAVQDVQTFTVRSGRGWRRMVPINRFLITRARRPMHDRSFPNPHGQEDLSAKGDQQSLLA